MPALPLEPAEYWARFEPLISITSLSDAINWAAQLEADGGSGLVFRGQDRADWPLDSSLYRRFPARPMEPDLVAAEQAIMTELRKWQLNLHASGLLPALPLLATLQHLGGRTRLIDVSHSLARRTLVRR